MAQPSINVKDAAGATVQIYSINPNGQTPSVSAQSVVIASDQSAIPIAPVGIGTFALCPSGSANGTVIGSIPAAAQGVRFLMPVGASVTYTRATSAPVSPPSITWQISNAISGPTYDEPLAGGVNLYITSITGVPLYFWL